MAESRKRLVWSVLAAAAVVAALAAGGVYVTLGGQGNGAVAAECRPAVARAKTLDPLIGGEVAAFDIVERPESLSDLAFLTADGASKTLGAFQGKVALVNLWATWCVPCRQEMPALDRLQAALGGDDFAVVPISIDIGDPGRPAAFLQSIGIKNLPLYTDRTTKIFEELKARGLAVGLPVTVLLDRNGCTLGHINGPAEWDSADGQKLIEAAVKSVTGQT
jgi:thiol-disulfide isomerase/thioredoxin